MVGIHYRQTTSSSISFFFDSENSKTVKTVPILILSVGGSGEGRLESKLSGLALDVEGGNTKPGARVWMFSKNPTAAQ